MTTDELRHLLEMAARALGYAFIKPADGYDGRLGLEIGDNPMRTQSWNPYTDDGDSARMRSALGIGVQWKRKLAAKEPNIVDCYADRLESYPSCSALIADHNGDRNAALRLCALRVAAAIGEGMK